MDDFNKLYKKNWKKVYITCYDMLGNHALAEEVTQETFLKLSVNLDTINEATVGAWLKTVAKNLCINILKKQQTEKRVMDELSVEPDTIGKELMKEAKEIAKSLAPKYREIFHLAFVCGLHNREIADHLHVPLTTVKSRLKVCLDKIARKLV